MNSQPSFVRRLINAASRWYSRPPYPQGYVFNAPAKCWEPPAWFAIVCACVGVLLLSVGLPVFLIYRLFW